MIAVSLLGEVFDAFKHRSNPCLSDTFVGTAARCSKLEAFCYRRLLSSASGVPVFGDQ